MIIERLVLPRGGIIGNQIRDKQQTDTATLCIGIGGTGMATLSNLKCKIRQQLEPDYPDDPNPQYGGIRLLAIDCDDEAYQKYSGEYRLSDDEYFSIRKPNLWDQTQGPVGKGLIKTSAYLNWLDVDGISSPANIEPRGRQIGRYLIFESAAKLVETIRNLCTAALAKRRSKRMDIHIFGGVSGGTASGGLLDICYLTRYVTEACGWDARIMGYFILPDVINSKPELAAFPEVVKYNNAAGYAVLKELDYLMDLRKANDYFEQKYTEQIAVKTQTSPVDVCFLVYSPDVRGKTLTTGFPYAIDSICEYVMQWLVGNEDDDAWTMHQTVRHAAGSVLGIPRFTGSNLCYHVLGMSSWKIPWNEMFTDLSVSFFRNYFRRVSAGRKNIPEDVIQQFMAGYKFRAEDIYAEVIREAPVLHLPEIDPAVLAAEPCCKKGSLPGQWAQAANRWLGECRRLRQHHVGCLTETLTDYSYEANHDRSLIGRLFRALYQLSSDPEYGPGFAANLLMDQGSDLYAALDSEILKAEKGAKTAQMRISRAEQWVIRSNQELIDSNAWRRKSACSVFLEAAEYWANEVNAYEQYVRTKEVLETFREQIKKLHSDFFRPLDELLCDLQETFEANAAYLQSEKNANRDGCTWNIVEFPEVQTLLDQAMDSLNMEQEISRFLTRLLNDPEIWQKHDSNRIAQFVCNQMTKLFYSRMDYDLRAFLLMKWPVGLHDPDGLIGELQKEFIPEIEQRLVPLFQCNPAFDLNNCNNTFTLSRFLLPRNTRELENAARDLSSNGGRHYAVQTHGRNDRIVLMTLISGVPMYAYRGITEYKADYDALMQCDTGIGIHLYANTGRGTDGSGTRDWYRFLPEPMPWSKVTGREPPGFERERQAQRLYQDACACGMITPKNRRREPDELEGRYVLCISQMPEMTLSADDLTDDGAFTLHQYKKMKEQYQQMLYRMHQPFDNPDCISIPLVDDGCLREIREAVRLDYFIKAPKLQDLVRQEIGKRKRLENLLERLNSLQKRAVDYEENLDFFSGLLFFRYLNCTNAMGYVDYVSTADIWVTSSAGTCLVLINKTMSYSPFSLYRAFLVMRDWFRVVTGLPKSGYLAQYDEIDLRNLYTDLSLRLAECRRKRRLASDYLVPAILSQIYNSQWIKQLTDGDLPDTYTLEEKKDMIRFYSGLRDRLIEMKNESYSWPVGYSLQQLNEALRDIPQWYI